MTTLPIPTLPSPPATPSRPRPEPSAWASRTPSFGETLEELAADRNRARGRAEPVSEPTKTTPADAPDAHSARDPEAAETTSRNDADAAGDDRSAPDAPSADESAAPQDPPAALAQDQPNAQGSPEVRVARIVPSAITPELPTNVDAGAGRVEAAPASSSGSGAALTAPPVDDRAGDGPRSAESRPATLQPPTTLAGAPGPAVRPAASTVDAPADGTAPANQGGAGDTVAPESLRHPSVVATPIGDPAANIDGTAGATLPKNAPPTEPGPAAVVPPSPPPAERRRGEAQRSTAATPQPPDTQRAAGPSVTNVPSAPGTPATAESLEAAAQSGNPSNGSSRESGRGPGSTFDTLQATTSAPTSPAVGRATDVEARIEVENLARQLAAGADGRVQSGPTPAGPNGLAQSLAAERVEAAVAVTTTGAGDEPEFASRIVRGLAAMVNQRGGVMTMRLQPPELGDLRVQMSITQGTVNATFTATTDQAQQLLQHNLTALRAALESQGLTVDKLGVHTAAPADNGSGARAEHNASGEREQAGSEHDASQGRSRGRSQDEGGERQPSFMDTPAGDDDRRTQPTFTIPTAEINES